jgi:Micro-tubular organiser Mto1 C-term Mto2-binding region
LLDKERQAHRNTKHQHETFLKTHQHTTRTVSQQEARVLELEAARQQDRKKIAALENNFKDQMTERNNLLLALWNRLSALCGTEWTHSNSLINGRALPSLEAVSTMLPGFSKNLLAAVKTIETIIGGFKSRVRTIENNLWKEFQNLEHTLDLRTKKLDRLETVIKTGGIGSVDSKAEMQKLKEANRQLKEQLASLRNVDARTKRLEPFNSGSPSPSVPTGPRSLNNERTSTLTRHHSTSTVETLERPFSSGSSLKPGTSNGASNDEASEQRWIFRLRELERRLKAEREARLLDRSGARKRLEEGERRNEELKAELERARIRKETALH